MTAYTNASSETSNENTNDNTNENTNENTKRNRKTQALSALLSATALGVFLEGCGGGDAPAAAPIIIPPPTAVLGSQSNPFVATTGENAFTGSEGAASVSYAGSKAVSITLNDDLETPATVSRAAEGDKLTGIQNLVGTEYKDTLNGNKQDNSLQGGAGDDTLRGGEGNDSLNGGADNDTLYGGAGNDTIDGSAGIDELFGEAGNDTIDGGEGDDTISGGAGNDIIDGGTGDDTIYSDAGDDIIDGGTGDDTIYSGTGDDIIDGGAGNDKVLHGGAGDDTINSGTGDDKVLNGGAGADTYIFRVGDGADIIIEQVESAGTSIINLQFLGNAYSDADFAEPDSGDPLFARDGDNLVISIDKDTSDTIIDKVTINDAYNTDNNLQYTINVAYGSEGNLNEIAAADAYWNSEGGESKPFEATAEANAFTGSAGADWVSYAGSAEGVTIALNDDAAVAVTVANPDDGDGNPVADDTLTGFQNIIGTENDDILTGNLEANTLRGGDGGDMIDGGAGDDIIEGGAGDDIIEGGAGDDIIEGGEGGDTLEGGAGADTLEGGLGADTYVYHYTNTIDRKDGADSITEVDGGNTIRIVLEEVSPIANWQQEYVQVEIYDSNVVLTFADAANSITLSLNDVREKRFALEFADEFHGLSVAADELVVTGISDSGDETLAVVRQNTLLVTGDSDTLNADTISFEGFSSTDKVTLDLSAANPKALIDDPNGFSQSVIVENIRHIIGSDGADTLTGDDQANTLTGGAGVDTIKGGDGDDIIEGGADDDKLSGEGGTDTYIFASGHGADTIESDADGGNLFFRAAASLEAFSFGRTDNDNVKITVGSDSVEFLPDAYADGRYILHHGADDEMLGALILGVDGTFAGGVEKDVIIGTAQVDTINGGAGDDTIDGGAGDDTITGGTGSDTIGGGAGADTYIFRVGDGADTISDVEGDTMTLQFLDAYEDTDFTDTSNFAREGNNLVITLDSDQVTILNAYDDDPNAGTDNAAFTINIEYGVEGGSLAPVTDAFWHTFELPVVEGSESSPFVATVDANAFTGSAGADWVSYAGSDAVTITLNDDADGVAVAATVGGAADLDTLLGIQNIIGTDQGDTLTGNGQANTLQGGEGSDTLDGDAGDDTLDGGAGDDTYIFRFGDGADTIDDVAGDTMTLRFIGDYIAEYFTNTNTDNFARDGNNLVISFIASTDQVTIYDAYDADTTTGTGVAAFTINIEYGVEGSDPFNEVTDAFWHNLGA